MAEKYEKRNRIASQYIVEKLIVRNGCTMIVAQLGVGKSKFTRLLTGAIATGNKFLDQFETQKQRVLIINIDNPKIDCEMDLDLQNLSGDYEISIEDEIGKVTLQNIAKDILNKKYDTIVLDSVLKWNSSFGKGINTGEDFVELSSFISHCRSNEVTLILVHHLSQHKGSDIFGDVQDMILGFTGLTTQMDNTIVLGAPKDYVEGEPYEVWVRPKVKRHAMVAPFSFKQLAMKVSDFRYLDLKNEITKETMEERDIMDVFDSPSTWLTVKKIYTALQEKHGINSVREILERLVRKQQLEYCRTGGLRYHYHLFGATPGQVSFIDQIGLTNDNKLCYPPHSQTREAA